MTPTCSELPRRIADLLSTIGPIHEDVRHGYHFSLRVILRQDDAVAGFLVTQQFAERSPETRPGSGLQFKVPVGPAAGHEATYVFADSLESALEYIKQSKTGGA